MEHNVYREGKAGIEIKVFRGNPAQYHAKQHDTVKDSHCGHVAVPASMQFVLSVCIEHVDDSDFPYGADIQQAYGQQAYGKEAYGEQHRIRKKHP